MVVSDINSEKVLAGHEADRTLLLLAATLAFLIAVTPPTIIFSTGLRSQADILGAEVEINAHSITQVINRHPDFWQTQVVRIEEFLRRRPSDGALEIREVRNLEGQTVARIADPLAGTYFKSARTELFDSGHPVGHLIITRSLDELLKHTLIAAALSLAVALGFLMFTKFITLASLRRSQLQLAKQARYDALTGLFNRFSLQELTQQTLASAARRRESVAMLFLDLDKFKQINDTLGHGAGDLLLIDVAQRLRASVRDSDIVARLGGDEFVVVLTGLDGPATVGQVADKISRSLSLPFEISGKSINTSASIGISLFPADAKDVEKMMGHADLAMYHAKGIGPSSYQFFTFEMNQANLERITLEQDLGDALVREEFVLHYQPQINTVTGEVFGVEALVRWNHPTKGMIPPAEFIPAAEMNGLIFPLGEWVLNTACAQLRIWLDTGFIDLRMSVNVSARQFEDETLLVRVEQALEKHKLAPGQLELELTESVMFKNPQKAIDQMRRFRAVGVNLAIDDFGAGYSSLNYLRKLPVNRLKLDSDLIRDIQTNTSTHSICAATIRLAGDLGLDVIAEGVETQGEYDSLKLLHCPGIQGYFHSKPLPTSEIFNFMAQHRSDHLQA